MKGPPQLKDNACTFVKEMKSGKAPGPNKIPVEIYDAL